MKYCNHILIVDDEPEAIEGYCNFLLPEAPRKTRTTSRRLNHESSNELEKSFSQREKEFVLHRALSGEEAVKIFKSLQEKNQDVAAGFFDVKMPGGMDGLEAIMQIKKIDPRIHCVVVTAYHDRSVDEIQEIFGEDFKNQWDYLNKPFTQGEILQKARQMVSSWNYKNQIEILHEQIRKNDRLTAIGQLARGVGHEVGNILVRVIGKIDLALMEQNSAKIHDHLKAVIDAAERAGLIIKNLQSFSKQAPDLQAGNINDSIQSGLMLIQQELIRNRITLDKNLQDCPKIVMDKNSMAQVFLNIFINAIHAMENRENSKLQVSSCAAKNSEHKSGILIEVTDNGCGIEKSILPKIFDYTFSTKGERGSGLGLSISKEIVEAHQGTLDVQSMVNQGTTFRIWLPIQPQTGKGD